MSEEKETIINGIDVSECCFYNNGKCDNPNGMACNCINNAVCYFKELKRTRQINSELISKANAYDKLVILANDRLDIIDRLKQENEKLRQDWRLDCLKCEYKNTKADVDKYKQALEEIKEIILGFGNTPIEFKTLNIPLKEEDLKTNEGKFFDFYTKLKDKIDEAFSNE